MTEPITPTPTMGMGVGIGPAPVIRDAHKTLVKPAELRDAMFSYGSEWGYREKRMALRRMAMPVIESMWTTEEAVDLISASPLVGTGEKQINVRKQVSGLRDQFDLMTLFTFAYLGTGLPFVGVYSSAGGSYSSAGGIKRELDRSLMKELVRLALLVPDKFAWASTDSRTGYVFGRPSVLSDSIVKSMFEPLLDHCKDIPASHPAMTKAAAIIAAGGAEGGTTTTTTKEKTTMEIEVLTLLPEERKKKRGPATGKHYLPPDTSLEELIGMIQRVCETAGMEPPEACEVLQANMASSGQAERFEGALEILEMRGGLAGAPFRSIRKEHMAVVIDIVEAKGIADDLDALMETAPASSASSATIKDTTTTATTGHTETKTMSELADAMKGVKPEVSSMIDAMLQSAKLPKLSDLMDGISQRDQRLVVQGGTLERMIKEREELQRKLAEVESRPMLVSAIAASHDGTIPSGNLNWVPAHEAFDLAKGKGAFSFDVPVWTWDGVHPHVPAVDPHYVFRPFELMRVLYGIVANKRVYLHGHTGTGKTTLIEQVAARLGYAFMRLNFDSEISRMDLIGRDTLISEGGTTVSRFVDGILPQMMQSPCIGCFDELDFVRPDIAYVMQRMLEGDSLVITEDGGRVVKPHPMFRAFATGNTVGQGDEHGMYQGARVQSTALLDRFSVWQRIDYLKPEDRLALIKNRVPALNDEMSGKLNAYITEHLQAFTTSKVLQPLSPRGFLGLAEALVFFMGVLPSKKDAVQQALESTILDRASVQDRVVLKGLADRVFG